MTGENKERERGGAISMGLPFLIHLEGKIYSCKHCQTHLGISDDIMSRVGAHRRGLFPLPFHNLVSIKLVRMWRFWSSRFLVFLISLISSSQTSHCYPFLPPGGHRSLRLDGFRRTCSARVHARHAIYWKISSLHESMDLFPTRLQDSFFPLPRFPSTNADADGDLPLLLLLMSFDG